MRRAAWYLCCAVALSLPATASAWSPLRGENSNAKKGNELMVQEQYGAALEAYDEAARELPEERAVQLNRGLALLAQDLGEPAKEALLAAADPTASPATRADAYYNLGIAYARQGDAIAQQEEYEKASAQFREAADAFKRALRARPGDRNAAWNLEYAMKRIREEEDKQQEQQQEQDQQQESEAEDEGEQARGEEESQPIPRDEVQRFLDALEQSEENLPLQRARRRSAGRPPPEKDW